MPSKILFVIGSGANIGAATVKTFLAAGWKVAQASRSAKPEDSTPDNLHVKIDLSDPETVTTAFQQVRAKLGEPSAVIFNAVSFHEGGAQNTLFRPTISDFASALTVNVTSVFVAAREALTSFDALPSSIPKTFSFTGNILNEQNPIPGYLTLGVGKSATAYLIAEADAVYSAAPKGYRFYFVDERLASGAAPGHGISGAGHAEFFLQLAEGTAKTEEKGEKVPWQATFVSGKGYVKFPYRGVPLLEGV